jgi:hypothetical protein
MAKTLGAVALVATALLATAPAHANLVSNGEFKAGGAGWTFTPSAFWASGAYGVIKDTLGGISQTVATVSGQTYKLSAFLGVVDFFGGSLNGNSTLSIFLGGQLLQTFTAATLPQSPFEFEFVAGAGTKLSFVGETDVPNVAISIDDVSLTAVPGPLAGAGLPVVAGMIAYGAWRRRKQAA